MMDGPDVCVRAQYDL